MTDKLPPNSILIVMDDTTKTFGLLFDYLRGSGFRVLVAHDGESALEMVEYIRPDIILLDVILAGINGFETCRRLKLNQTTHDIPVIFLATSSSTFDRVRGFTLGAVDYVTRPIQAEEVLARLKTHLTIQNLQRSLEEKNARLQEEITEREKLIGELDAFAHTVAHDLKNPLGVTINYAQFLKSYHAKMSTEEWQKSLDVIEWNGQKMSNIINELLLLASVRKEEVELEPVDMASVLGDVQSRLSYMIEEYQAEIVVPDDWPVALGYAPWIEEIWTNYLSNAIKYGGHPPRVELGSTVQPDGRVQFWVRDNGQGLTPEQQAQLFVPFTRLDQARAEGHGLGLSIVQRIVQKLGGEVGVASEGLPDQGSVFSFILPQAGEE